MMNSAFTSSDGSAPALGRKVEGGRRALDTFELPESMWTVVYTSDEFTAVCPITGQPDYYTVRIELVGPRGIESKSLKLYLGAFRNEGSFCEALADTIASDVALVTNAHSVQVALLQKSRGGITIEATSITSSSHAQDQQRGTDDEGHTVQGVPVRGSAPPPEPRREVP
jgi:7-cyano-7-deazaguanine reductase